MGRIRRLVIFHPAGRCYFLFAADIHHRSFHSNRSIHLYIILIHFFFTSGQVLWLTCITIPILAISLIGAPTNPSVMSIATGKNVRNIDREVRHRPIPPCN